LDKFLKGKSPFEGLDYTLILNEWEKYYWKIHGLRTDFAGIPIPKADENDFPWLVCVPENFSTERAYSGGEKLYAKWKYTNKSLDDVLDLSFGRDARTNPYIVRFRENWEADKNLKGISADAIAEKGIDTSTLKERLLLGDFLFWKHQRHLDQKNWTLCAGSRYSDGFVPDVLWAPRYREVFVVWSFPDGAGSVLRAREVVSC